MNEQELIAKYDVSKTLSDRLLRKTTITLDEVGDRLAEFMLDLHTLPDAEREAFSKKYLTHDLAVKEQEFFTLYSRLLTANKRAASSPLKPMTLNGSVRAILIPMVRALILQTRAGAPAIRRVRRKIRRIPIKNPPTLMIGRSLTKTIIWTTARASFVS